MAQYSLSWYVKVQIKDSYEIIAGKCCWWAGKIANLDSASVIVKDLSDKECLEVSIIKNIQRQDINLIEEGDHIKLIGKFFYTHEELALATGKSRSYITNMTRMLSLPDSVKMMINEKVIYGLCESAN